MTSLKRTRESELEVETQESVLQTPRPVQGRKRPDREEEWVVSSLQQIKNRLQMLEDTPIIGKAQIRKLLH